MRLPPKKTFGDEFSYELACELGNFLRMRFSRSRDMQAALECPDLFRHSLRKEGHHFLRRQQYGLDSRRRPARVCTLRVSKSCRRKRCACELNLPLPRRKLPSKLFVRRELRRRPSNKSNDRR